MTTSTAHVLGVSSETHWCQTYHEGDLFLVLEIKSQNEETKAAVLGKAYLEKLLSLIHATNPKTLKELSESVERVLTHGSELFIAGVVGLLVNDILYIAVVKGGAVYLARGQMLGNLLDRAGTVSGKVQEGDTIFYFSPALREILAIEAIRATIGKDPLEISEILAPYLHTTESFGAAGIISRIKASPSEETLFLSRNDSEAMSTTETFKKKHQWMGLKHLSYPWQTLIYRLQVKTSKFSKKQKFTGLFLFILISLFLARLYIGWANRVHIQSKERIASERQAIKLKLEEGRGLIELNAQRARVVLEEAKKQGDALENKIRGNQTEDQEVKQLVSEIEKALEQAAKKYKLSDVPLFYDLTLIKNNALGKEVAQYRNSLVLLDIVNTSLYHVTTDTKQGAIIGGGERLKGASHITLFGDTAYVYTDQGIVSISLGSKEAKTVIEADHDIGSVSAMTSFAGNLYLVDSTNNTLWKYQAVEAGFGPKILYLPNDSSHSFNDKTSIAIDGVIWTITGNRLAKFFQGRPDGAFALSGLDQPFLTDTLIYTDDTLDKLYILDRGNKRLVVFDKKGVYEAQYIWEKIPEVVSLAVSKEKKKVLLLSGSKIYGVDMK